MRILKIIELDYENSIQEIQTGKYYAVWVISGHGSSKLSNGVNSNLVFIPSYMTKRFIELPAIICEDNFEKHINNTKKLILNEKISPFFNLCLSSIRKGH